MDDRKWGTAYRRESKESLIMMKENLRMTVVPEALRETRADQNRLEGPSMNFVKKVKWIEYVYAYI